MRVEEMQDVAVDSLVEQAQQGPRGCGVSTDDSSGPTRERRELRTDLFGGADTHVNPSLHGDATTLIMAGYLPVVD
jgi:hypothetical protein